MAQARCTKIYRITALISLTLICSFGIGNALAATTPQLPPIKPLNRQTGVVTGSEFFGQPQAQINAQLDLIKNTGTTYVRLSPKWFMIEAHEGTFDWAQTDQVFMAIKDRNLIPLININPTTAPFWATGFTARAYPPNPEHFLNFGIFVRTFSQHLKDEGITNSIWQIGNEPNVKQDRWMSGPSPALYTLYLKSAYREIKAIFPQTTVLTAGMGANRGNDEVPGNMTGPQFIRGIYESGGRGYFDAVSYHPYELYPGSVQRDGWVEMYAVRQIMAEYGDGTMKLWATEVGSPSGAIGEEEQAILLANIYKKFRAYSWAGPMLYYQLQDKPALTSGANQPVSFTHGLVRVDGSLKPAYYAFVEINRQ